MGAQVVPRGRAVHPRVGGERCDKVKPALAAVGSSPRGRGTPRCPAIFVTKIRFIPAWAGNAWGGGGTGLQPAVHPRVGGERCGPDGLHCGIGGSSPRGRGTLDIGLIDATRFRFIPAWAGNAYRSTRFTRYSTVHPRVGGERRYFWGISQRGFGSSPRGRGTPAECLTRSPLQRFIPAWAGNALPPWPQLPIMPVHPRVGGERILLYWSGDKISGSSPRGRGTRLVIRISPGWPRFIPAWAGNAPIGNRQCSRVSVHPRVGGERSMPQTYSARAAGSSPRGRGTPIPEGGKHASRRFIPAWAGNANHLGMA